ncbi:MAG: hypothetical protein ACD_16C00195G0006 [uncultured bacterium]|nr:MAG: hypothetical protein ACD_16C00195G0006 [uncultured bacterium]OFW69053.1 MAG: hypothetical protein A2X70_00690 [Alphaproteobacteria bacterium GWC2_42_16]OFW82230.1 MAG: hypothetical protein A3E50_04610 [Alphaproteobacteria bacterium RIFCSPHIGHO2_12_FULL_42_100]OFW86471.1 MAG: hypothetical protein A2W06_00405 [Alphaproteobacteria bacterium RBG_16_42_14]OFW91396.1 MAG: hypothetical protein A3C41_06900 [Alphaproteobacteria bacterium RIFCSPHIGHO2_02_FULL_42_30]OFW93710.1 MAG: hypothetical p
MPNPEPQDSPDFSALEKEALKEISLDIIKSDLKISLTQLHQKNMKEVKEEIAAIEERCAQEIKDGLETQLQKKLKVQFQKLIDSSQHDISKTLSPLVKGAEEDIQSLNHAVSQTNKFCTHIQKQYEFRWGHPSFLLLFTSALTGALMGLILFLLQVPSIAVLLMNAHTRKAYDIGVRVMNFEEELRTQPQKPITPETVKKKKKPSK